MKKKITIVMGLVMLGTVSAAEAQDVFYDTHLAQGDGDPEELAAAEKAMSEDEMALLTPEGDFLVPTFLLPTVPPIVHENALAPKSEEEEKEEAPVEANQKEKSVVPEIKQVPQPKVEQEVKAETKPETKPVEQTPVEQTAGNDKTMSAAEKEAADAEAGSKTTLEPVMTEQTEEVEESKTEAEISALPPAAEEDALTNDIPAEEEAPAEIITPVSEEDEMQFNLKTRPKRKPEVTPTPPPRVRQLIPFDYADTALASFTGKTRLSFKMPKEMKVIFYPNATDISGQTMKWIRVFALQALRDARLRVDMRVSTHNLAVQQARIGLITRMLQDQGLTAHQIQISYTDRDENSLILSLRNYELETQNLTTKKRFGKVETKKIQQW